MPRPRPAYADAPAEHATKPPNACAGWPWCRQPGTLNGACPEHREIYDRVWRELHKKAVEQTAPSADSSVTIRHVDPQPRRGKAKPRKPSVAHELRSAILAALRAHDRPLSADELAAACRCGLQNASFKAVRAQLLKTGVIVKTGVAGIGCTYGLAGSPRRGAEAR
jgi:hypothetical protein